MNPKEIGSYSFNNMLLCHWEFVRMPVPESFHQSVHFDLISIHLLLVSMATGQVYNRNRGVHVVKSFPLQRTLHDTCKQTELWYYRLLGCRHAGGVHLSLKGFWDICNQNRITNKSLALAGKVGHNGNISKKKSL